MATNVGAERGGWRGVTEGRRDDWRGGTERWSGGGGGVRVILLFPQTDQSTFFAAAQSTWGAVVKKKAKNNSKGQRKNDGRDGRPVEAKGIAPPPRPRSSLDGRAGAGVGSRTGHRYKQSDTRSL